MFPPKAPSPKNMQQEHLKIKLQLYAKRRQPHFLAKQTPPFAGKPDHSTNVQDLQLPLEGILLTS